MQVFGLAGGSDGGRAGLLLRVVRALSGRGLRLSVVREAPRGYDIDTSGKDTYQHRTAGAAEVLLCSSQRWVLMHERRNQSWTPPSARPPLPDILRHMSEVDLVLVDGFGHEPHPKIEVDDDAGSALRAGRDPTILAVASDRRPAGLAVPVLDLADDAGIAAFIVARSGLQDVPRRGGGEVALRRLGSD